MNTIYKEGKHTERGLIMGIKRLRGIPSLTVLAAGCAIALLLAGCGKKKEAEVKPPPPQVVVAQAVVKKIPIVAEYSGTVKAVKTVDIIPRVTGYLEKRYFTEGSTVKKGDLLYLIDPKPFQARLDAAKAQLQMHQAMLTFWKSEVQRYNNLAAKGAASMEKKEATMAKLQETLAAIQKDKADIELAKLELGYTKITAPFTGKVQATRIHEGNLVVKDRDVLTTLVQMDPIQVVFNVGRKEVYGLQRLKQKNLLLPRDKMEVRLVLPDGSIYSEVGRIDYVSSRINPATDCVTVRSIFHNKSLGKDSYVFIPGQYAPVKVTLGYNPKALLIPASAVVEDQTGIHVMVVGKGNKVEMRKVEVGATYKNYKEITKGLKEGEIVIIKGVQKVKSGMEVKPMIEPPAEQG